MKIQLFGISESTRPPPVAVVYPLLHPSSLQWSVALRNYRENRENGSVKDNPGVFPSASFDTLDIKESTYKPRGSKGEEYYPDKNECYWLKLTLSDGRIIEDFYWKKDKIRGWPDRGDKDRYWFTVHHAPTSLKIEGFSSEPDRQGKGFPDREGAKWRYIKYTECAAIKAWMEEKDRNYLARIAVYVTDKEILTAPMALLSSPSTPLFVYTANPALTALHEAVKAGDEDSVEALVQEGALLEQLNAEGETALLVAVRCDQNAMVDILLRHGACLEFQNSKGESAEHLALQLKNQALVYYFRSNRALFARDASGNTALHRAVARGNWAEANDLLQSGAYVNALNLKGESALHLLAQKAAVLPNRKSLAELLIKAGIDLNWFDNTGLRAVEQIGSSAITQDLIILLLEQRNTIPLQRVKCLLQWCCLRYVGDFESRAADKALLDKTISSLCGKIDGLSFSALMQRYMLIYLGHLNSLSGSYSRLSHNIVDEEFTGFRAEKFLPLRARVLLEMIVRIKKGLLLDTPCSKEESLVKLTTEFFYILDMLHACLDRCFIENSGKVEWAIQAHVNHLTKQILALPVGSSYGYAGGWQRHAVYIEFEHRADSPRSLIVRIDNLGERYNEFHISKKTPFQHKSGSGDKVLPYLLQFPLTERVVKSYIEQMVKAKFKSSAEGSSLLYDTPTRLCDKTIIPRVKIEEWYSWRRAQSVGNCSIKNAQPGLQKRWQTGNPTENKSHQFYYYFREKEHQFIPIKSYLSAAVKISGFSAPTFNESSSSSMSSAEEMDIPFELAEEMMTEARAQGYTDLHLAVISGDLHKVRQAIMAGAKPEYTTQNGYNALHLAVLHNQLSIANYLLSVATTPERLTQAVTSKGDGLLHMAMRQSIEDETQTLDFIRLHQIKIEPSLNEQGISPHDYGVTPETQQLQQDFEQKRREAPVSLQNDFLLITQREHQLRRRVDELTIELEQERRAQKLLEDEMRQQQRIQEQQIERLSQQLAEEKRAHRLWREVEIEAFQSQQTRVMQDMRQELDSLKATLSKAVPSSPLKFNEVDTVALEKDDSNSMSNIGHSGLNIPAVGLGSAVPLTFFDQDISSIQSYSNISKIQPLKQDIKQERTASLSEDFLPEESTSEIKLERQAYGLSEELAQEEKSQQGNIHAHKKKPPVLASSADLE